jgi:hypothetical protein
VVELKKGKYILLLSTVEEEETPFKKNINYKYFDAPHSFKQEVCKTPSKTLPNVLRNSRAFKITFTEKEASALYEKYIQYLKTMNNNCLVADRTQSVIPSMLKIGDVSIPKDVSNVEAIFTFFSLLTLEQKNQVYPGKFFTERPITEINNEIATFGKPKARIREEIISSLESKTQEELRTELRKLSSNKLQVCPIINLDKSLNTNDYIINPIYDYSPKFKYLFNFSQKIRMLEYCYKDDQI